MPTNSLTPTAEEQLLLEYINRLRLDPAGAADRLTGANATSNIQSAINYFGVDTDAFRAQMQAFSSVAPLAWNNNLADSAEAHTQLMIDQNTQAHQLSGEGTLSARIVADGYQNYSTVSENIFAFAHDPLYAYAGFVIDWGYDAADIVNGALISNWASTGDGIQDAAGHRVNMLSANVTEVGIALLEHSPTSPGDVGPMLVTQDFGSRWDYKSQLVGVVIADADGDAFYDIGEGLGGITVTATGSRGSYSTTSWSSGGYQMELPTGSYSVSFSGGSLAQSLTYSVTIAAQNVKLDAFAADAPGAPETHIGTRAVIDTLTGHSGNDRLFGDGVIAHYYMEEAQQVYRLYQATLDRAPDVGGLNGWTKVLAFDERTALQVATGFVGSAEFQKTYGALSNTGFVQLLYQNVLNRAPDANGLSAWVSVLDSGWTKAQVVLGFSDSTEFVKATRAASEAFVVNHDAATWTDDVFRLYQATLDRAPDLAGFQGWTALLGDGSRDFLTVVTGFVGSTEFQNTYGALSNTGFVELLYQNVLNRAPDANGLSAWVSLMEGGMSRAQVVQGFSQSPEFIAATNSAVKTWIQAQTAGDVLNGGGGENELWGGMMADQFVFEQATNGTHRVNDFEAWDQLNFKGFGYGTADEARGHMVQTGADVVFTDQGVTVELLHVQLAALEADNFLFS